MAVISDTAAKAIYDAVAHRGASKGMFKAAAPPSRTLAYAAWQAAMMSINPFKVSIGGLMFMSAEQRAVYDEVLALFDRITPAIKNGLDRDRKTIESLGVW